MKGGHFEDQKIQKQPHIAEKMEGDPLVSFGFVCYVKN